MNAKKAGPTNAKKAGPAAAINAESNTAYKNTETLRNELKAVTDIEDYLSVNRAHLLPRTQPLAQHLTLLLRKKRLKRGDVARASLLDRVYVYQIFSGKRTPSRDKLIALAFGMRLSTDETQQMLKLSGNLELYAKCERDALILFAMQKGMSIQQANDLLFAHEEKLLGTQGE